MPAWILVKHLVILRLPGFLGIQKLLERIIIVAKPHIDRFQELNRWSEFQFSLQLLQRSVEQEIDVQATLIDLRHKPFVALLRQEGPRHRRQSKVDIVIEFVKAADRICPVIRVFLFCQRYRLFDKALQAPISVQQFHQFQRHFSMVFHNYRYRPLF